MIRINLLGQIRPKATKQAVPLEATIQVIFLVVAVVVAAAVLSLVYVSEKHDLDRTNQQIVSLRAEKASLQQIKADVDHFKAQKAALQQRIDVIETLQKNRSGAQDLLQNVANTVGRVDALWLTSVERKGDALNISGEAASINSVANFITQLKRSGYFDKVEIQTAKEDDLEPAVQTYGFTMTAQVNSSGAPSGQPSGAPPAAAPAPRGRS